MDVTQLNKQFEGKSPLEVLRYFLETYKGKIALASSLSIEDQTLTEMICAIDKDCKIFTLDTGRLFPQTYSLINKTKERFGKQIEIYFPNNKQVEAMVNVHGVNLFYESVELRKKCCHVRKIEPLKRAFEGLEVWICGLRREQSVTRADNQVVEWDAGNKMIKINPLIEWSESQVWDYIKQHQIPYNALHDKGFPSIGCQPCTRAVEAGEDVRAGRWWWENPEQKECGLHNQR